MSHVTQNALQFLLKFGKRDQHWRNYGKTWQQFQLGSETLTGRLVAYLGEKQKLDNKVVEITPRKTKSRNYLTTFNTSDVLKSLDTLKNRDFKSAIKLIDAKCNSQVNELTTSETLQILNRYMVLTPNRITEFAFYKSAIKQMHDNVQEMSQNELIQFLFYVALTKKNPDSQKMTRHVLKIIKERNIAPNLSKEELCILCNSTFKTATKINDKTILNVVRQYLNDHLNIMDDSHLFVALLKTIRHNRYQDENLLESVTCTIFFNKPYENYNFVTYCHILASYADYLYYDERLLSLFTKKCVEKIQTCNEEKENSADQFRAKDLKRFLWSLANLNADSLSKDDIKTIVIPNIIERICKNEYDDIFSLVDIFLSLWIIKYKPYELVPYIFTQKNIQDMKTASAENKQKLNLLLTSIYLEDRQLFKQLNIRPEVTNTSFIKEKHIIQRPALKRVYNAAKNVTKHSKINKFSLDYQLPHLNILGVTGYAKNIYKALHIEVLDDFTTLKNTDLTPTGYMQLKMRILDASDEGLIVVQKDFIEDMTEQQLQDFLIEEIKIVC